MTRTITDEQIERLGVIANWAGYYLRASMLESALHTKVTGLRGGMQAIKDEAEALYRELGGEEEQR